MKLSHEERKRLAWAIRGRHRDFSLSNGQIAALASVDPGQTSRILDGKFQTVSGNVLRICNVLGVDPNAPGADEPSPEQVRRQVAWAKLKASMRRAWDETPQGADRLVAVIDAVTAVQAHGRKIQIDADASLVRNPAA